MDEGGGEEEPPTWCWEHAIIWVNYDLPSRMDGSDLLDQGTGWYAGICVKAHPERIVVGVLFE